MQHPDGASADPQRPGLNRRSREPVEIGSARYRSGRADYSVRRISSTL